jgi:MFS superfamily sulfate permease-like transporter
VVASLPSWRRNAKRDALAALTVWAVVVPQGMAYAALAGVPPVRGLYAACAGLLIYALLGTCRQLNVGPSSGIAILSAATVAPLAGASASRYLGLTALLALMVGVILVVAGLARLGFLAEFLAKPVLTGYLVGLGLVILAGQVSSLLGLPGGSGNFFELARNVVVHLNDLSGWTTVIGLASLALILGLRAISPRIPGALVAVVVGIVASRALDLDSHGVAELGKIVASTPRVTLPEMSYDDVERLLSGALGISLLAYAESIAAARFFATKHRYEVDANRELIALGSANIGSGCCRASRSTPASRGRRQPTAPGSGRSSPAS